MLEYKKCAIQWFYDSLELEVNSLDSSESSESLLSC